MKAGGFILAGGLALGGAYGYAKYDITERTAAFEREASEISAGRGGHLPSEDDVRAAAEDIAARHNLEVVDISVSFEPLTPQNAHRAGPGVAMAQDAAASIAAKAAELDPMAAAGGDAITAAASRGTLIDITAQVRAKKLFVSSTKSLSATAFIRHGAQYE